MVWQPEDMKEDMKKERSRRQFPAFRMLPPERSSDEEESGRVLKEPGADKCPGERIGPADPDPILPFSSDSGDACDHVPI